MSTEARPNLFIVGAQKSGTSALAGWLGQHPEAHMSFPKEPGYLAFGAAGYPFPDGYGRPAPASRYVVRDEASYLALFAGADDRARVLGEASTWYLAIPGMAARLNSFNPRARALIVLRNPVDRAWSAWRHARRDDVEPCADFRDALARESQRGEVEFLLRYRRMGLYAGAIEEYREAFGPARLRVLFYDDLRSDPARFWREVCGFLGIDPAFEPPFELRYNRGGEPRSRALQRLLGSQQLKRAARAVLPHRVGLAIKGRVEDANLREPPPPDASLRAELLEYFREDIAQVSRLTGRDLGSWLQ